MGAFNQLFRTYIYNIWYIHTLPTYYFVGTYIQTDSEPCGETDRRMNKQTTKQTSNQTSKHTQDYTCPRTYTPTHYTRTHPHTYIHLNNYCRLIMMPYAAFQQFPVRWSYLDAKFVFFLRHFPRTQFGLRVDPDARLCVSLGRLVRQKGVDILADVAEWLLSTYPKVDLLVQKCATTLHFFDTVKLKGLRDWNVETLKM